MYPWTSFFVWDAAFNTRRVVKFGPQGLATDVSVDKLFRLGCSLKVVDKVGDGRSWVSEFRMCDLVKGGARGWVRCNSRSRARRGLVRCRFGGAKLVF